MTALPLTTSHAPDDTRDTAREFHHRLARLEEGSCRLWSSVSQGPLRVGRPTTRWSQGSNYRAAKRLIDETARRIEGIPAGEAARREWRTNLQEEYRRFGQQRLHWPEGYRDLLLADEFWASTTDFVRRARRFAPTVSPEDLFQALRNVWIMNSAQMLLDLDVRTTRSVFAYSMLYPWTDNYLDDPNVSRPLKEGFNERLERRLRGLRPDPTNQREREVFALVALIESEFPRSSYPESHLSLQAIHRGQIDSLRQHSGDVPQTELLRISVRKGGASVLPDAYLVAGRLDLPTEKFMFGYGVFLQLLDDLQDVRVDSAAGHRTLFTSAAEAGPLDAEAGRLHSFIEACLTSSECFAGPEYASRLDLIRRNCTSLLVGAVAEAPGSFSRSFIRELERQWPLRFAAIRRLRRYAQERFRKLGPLLRARFGTDSVLDLICRDER